MVQLFLRDHTVSIVDVRDVQRRVEEWTFRQHTVNLSQTAPEPSVLSLVDDEPPESFLEIRRELEGRCGAPNGPHKRPFIDFD